MTHPQAEGYYKIACDRISLTDRLQYLFDQIDDVRADILVEMMHSIGDHLTISSSQEVQNRFHPTAQALQEMLHTLQEIIKTNE